MRDDKLFLTYNQQMKKLRNDKHIICNGSNHKKILVRSGYFNIVNGYKTPFVSGTNSQGTHYYISGTSINQLQAVKDFDNQLRLFLLKYITQVEEETRTLTGYKFDECNSDGAIPWYDTDAYAPTKSLQSKMNVISKAYSELSQSKLDYVKFYMDNHKQIPTWIMIKVVNFSTFIDIINCSKPDVSHALCNLYGLTDSNGLPNVKLLIGSLHWMRKIRNACAHNERVYCISRKGSQNGRSGRILENYFLMLRQGYRRNLNQSLFDLIVYCKYFLPKNEYKQFVSELKNMLSNLSAKIHPHAFEYVRGQMGILDISDLDILLNLPKDEIEYNKFDTQ